MYAEAVDLPLLQAIALAVGENRDPEAVLGMIVSGLVEKASCALARIWLLEGSALRLAASAGQSLHDGSRVWTRLDRSFQRIEVGAGKIGTIAASGRASLIEDVSTDGLWIVNPEWARAEQIRSFAGHPLVYRRKVLGVLGVFSRTRLGREEFGWLELFAHHAAIALSNARAFEEIESLRRKLELENEYLREEVNASAGGILGQSGAIERLLNQIHLMAVTEANVLIQGESGTGKELVARSIHENSSRRNAPLVKVNCASVPNELFESEFFGHAKGAFTGAVRDRVGRFQLADRGTLFLDEVGEIPLQLQGKLLRVIQEGEFERLGEDRSRKVDVRIIAATNRDLKAEIAAGRFRQDLFYRLSVFPIVTPPLRDRREDIAVLAGHFLRQSAKRLNVSPAPLMEQDLNRLTSYDWPGNVRELQHVMERAVILAGGGRLDFDLPASSISGPSRASGSLTRDELRELERKSIEGALAKTAGKIYGNDGAAKMLGMKPTTLASRIQSLGIARRQGGLRD